MTENSKEILIYNDILKRYDDIISLLKDLEKHQENLINNCKVAESIWKEIVIFCAIILIGLIGIVIIFLMI